VNQVHQLDIGHQITINEGKYGVYKNGTIGSYFQARGNILMYSLALPITSLPVLKLFGLFTDHFRLLVITLWAFLPFLSALVISSCYPKWGKLGNLRITIITAVIGFLLLAANLLVYFPFIWSAPDAPFEVAAVVFTNHILFALTMVMVYLIALTLFENRWKALFAGLACGSSSAYLIWGANAKDHMASVLFFAVILFCFARYFSSRKTRDAAAGFFFIGILTWYRLEVGFSAFVCISIFFIAEFVLRMHSGELQFGKDKCKIFLPLVTAIGAIPFFLNNYIVSGSPFTPAFLIPGKEVAPAVGGVIQLQPVTPMGMVSDMIVTIGKYYFTITPNPLPDIYGLLFFPASGMMGMFFVCPLALLSLLLLPIMYLQLRTQKSWFHHKNTQILFLLVASASIILAYLHCLPLLNSDPGVGPDIRYLSPLYIPIVLMSLLLLEGTILFTHPRTLVLRSCTWGLVFIPVLLLVMILFTPVWTPVATSLITPVWTSFYPRLPYFFILAMLAEIVVTLTIVGIYHFTQRKADTISDLCLPVLIMTILTWQLMMDLIISPVAKFNGYPFFWIPAFDVLFHSVINVSVIAP